MRVAQVIDSLDAGGAERMAINFANNLSNKLSFSAIIATRAKGSLAHQINNETPLFLLNKKAIFDFKALLTFRHLLRQNKIETLHVHGTSFFFCFLVKIINFKTRLIYHEHYGNRAAQSAFKNLPLLFCLLFFDKILVVNNSLENWFINLGFKKVFFVPNFATFDDKVISRTQLAGIEGKRIVCLSNLKKPKNHLFLLEAFYLSKLLEIDWTVHLIGKIFNDVYYADVLDFIKKHNLQNNVFLYDVQSDIKNILKQSNIGVLCSTNEGFPVTLLEYGLAKLPVVSTNVGFCPEIIIENETGLLFDPLNIDEFILKLNTVISDKNLQKKVSLQLYNSIQNSYCTEIILQKIIAAYEN